VWPFSRRTNVAIDFTEIKAVLEDVKTKVGPLVAAVEAAGKAVSDAEADKAVIASLTADLQTVRDLIASVVKPVEAVVDPSTPIV
jgi:hypothetical protein